MQVELTEDRPAAPGRYLLWDGSEWGFVVMPYDGCDYLYYPQRSSESKGWYGGKDWRRSVEPIEDPA